MGFVLSPAFAPDSQVEIWEFLSATQ
jgi:hypothetical protein